jgi:hypothetical protein
LKIILTGKILFFKQLLEDLCTCLAGMERADPSGPMA